jgi:hypothetical protein
MKFRNWILPLALVAVDGASAFPTAQHWAKLMSKKSGPTVEKRCPFADIKDGIERAVQKRSSLNPLASPIAGVLLTLLSNYSRCGSDRIDDFQSRVNMPLYPQTLHLETSVGPVLA